MMSYMRRDPSFVDSKRKIRDQGEQQQHHNLHPFLTRVHPSTLDYLINVGLRLLFFWQFSTHCALIPYSTYINYGQISTE